MIFTIKYPDDAGKKFEMFRYPAGEVQVRFNPKQLEDVRNADEVYILANIKDGEIMGLAMLNNALKNENMVVTLFLPYLPYSRADRQFAPGDCFGLHVFAEHINQMDFDQVVTLDVHSDIADIEIDNLINVPPARFIPANLASGPGTVILLPDEGSYNRYSRMLKDVFPCRILYAKKQRNPVTGALEGFIVPSKEVFTGCGAKKVLIVDDICDGGGTFIGIAEAMKDYGLELNLYVTHGVFSKGVSYLLNYFKNIYTTDSFGAEGYARPGVYGRLTIFPCYDIMLESVSDQYKVTIPEETK